MEKVEPVINGKETFKSFKSGFNLKKVIRCEELDNGNVLVLLNDIHQRPVEMDIRNKQGKITSTRREMQTFQSEIYLTETSDIQRFYETTNVENVYTVGYDPDITEKS